MALVDKNALAALQDMGYFADVNSPNHIYRFFADLTKKSFQLVDQDWQILFESGGGTTGGLTPHISWVSESGSDATAVLYAPFSPYKTIAAAQAASAFGDLIVVMPGSYTNLSFSPGIDVHLLEGANLLLTLPIATTTNISPFNITGKGTITNLGLGFVIDQVGGFGTTINLECRRLENLADLFSVIGVTGNITINAETIAHGGSSIISYSNSGLIFPDGNSSITANTITSSSVGPVFRMVAANSAVANTHYLNFKEANLNIVSDNPSLVFVNGAASKKFFINGESLVDSTVFVGGSFASIFMFSTNLNTKCYIDIDQVNGSAAMSIVGLGIRGFASVKGRYDGNVAANAFNVIGMTGNGEFNGVVTGYSDGGAGVIQFGNIGVGTNNFIFNGVAYNKVALGGNGVFIQPGGSVNVLFPDATIYVTDAAAFSITDGGVGATIQIASVSSTNIHDPALVEALGGQELVLATLFNPYTN